ncbi:MAG: prepilin-type N-terminal cleavage/methylation domain-containing protein [Desulfuromonadaceae bacterium]|nr:prepilin-type N-terminal cleavage/methylation domain-containing protein [Desulfuromonadaceae bacterium]
MMRSLLKNKNGFSLVEILVVIAMLGIVMGAVYTLFITHQRTAYTSDETVEVQQNLRIAMDAVTKDLRMAGMLVDFISTTPISLTADNTGLKDLTADLIPGPDPGLGTENPGSDSVLMSMISASGVCARVKSDIDYFDSNGIYIFTDGKTLPVVSAKVTQPVADAELFMSGDLVSIIRPYDNSRLNEPTPPAIYTPYKVASTTEDSITFTEKVSEHVKIGDVIAKINVGSEIAAPYPNTVAYNVVDSSVAGCPANQFCLARTANGGTAVVAQNIADFQLRYVLDNNSVTDAPDNLKLVNSVIVTIWGETAATRMMSGNIPKIRQLSSVVRLRNRR